jgi:hypothetical protein
MHQAYELSGQDGKAHTIWAMSARDAHDNGVKWGYRHGGLASVSILAVHDPESEDCWKLARRFVVARSSDALAVAKQYGAYLDEGSCLRYNVNKPNEVSQ